MRVYHGTVDAFLPAIQSEGLKYTPNNSFKMDGLFSRFTSDPCVYLSTTRKGATMMAYVKAIYLARGKDEMIPGTAAPSWKTDDKVLKTRPVLLTLDIPKTLELKHDPDWGDEKTGLIYCGEIAPSHIVKVEVLEDEPAL